MQAAKNAPGAGQAGTWTRPRQKVSYEIVEQIAVLSASRRDGTTRELNLISYNGYAPRYDLRVWLPPEEDGTDRRPGKGITMNAAEIAALRDVLNGRHDL